MHLYIIHTRKKTVALLNEWKTTKFNIEQEKLQICLHFLSTVILSNKSLV